MTGDAVRIKDVNAAPVNIREQLETQKSINTEVKRRLSTYIYETINNKLVSEYEETGWVVDKVLKRSTKMRRTKSHDVAFEDRVWAAMAKLGFENMSHGRRFKISYGKGVNESKQIDVFAADEDVVLVVECKSTSTAQNATFKNDIEAIQGIRPGIIASIRKEFPGTKMRFILATNNYVLSPESKARVDASGLLHLDEDAVDYYLELAEHLGAAAKYQLLGNIFAGQKIPGLETKVPAIQGKMGGYTYYSFAIEPAKLLKIAFVLHRSKANAAAMPTYQRLIKKARLTKVSQFVDGGGFFPNSLIVNIDSDGRRVRFERVAQPIESSATLGVLHLPQVYRAAYVIDGQHRLYGYADSDRSESDLIPVVAFVGLPRPKQVELFMQINENQQAVPKNLQNTLNSDLLWTSSDLRDQIRALKLRVAQYLEESKLSPLKDRIIVGEDKSDNLRCLTIDSINSGLSKGRFLGTFTKTEIKDPGSFYRGHNQGTFEALSSFVEISLNYVKSECPAQWELGRAEGGFLFVNNGIESLLRILSDLIDFMMANEQINPRVDSPQSVFESIEPYLLVLTNYLKTVSPDEAADYRRQYGSAGRARYWRRLQTAINAERPEFEPNGLRAYLQDEQRAFNTESFSMIQDIETLMKNDIRRKLEDFYGSKWFKEGVPLKVYQSAISLAADKNRELSEDEEVEPWDCLHLIDYHSVVTMNHDQWQNLFSEQYTRPGEKAKQTSWKTKASWMVDLNRIRNENAHTYSVKESEFNFLTALHSWMSSRSVR